MKKIYYIFFIFILFACANNTSDTELTTCINQIDKKLKTSVNIYSNLQTSEFVSPRSVVNGKVKMVKPKDWTSGFFAGELWMMFKLSRDDFWKEKAVQFTLPLEQEKWNNKTHDMGFKMYNSFGKAWQLTKKQEYKDILIQSAKTLSTRFRPSVGCIRSWDHHSEQWKFPVIIDNMMNLELLFWAAKETGNNMYREIAVKHAETTMKNHFRKDNSSYHVVDYDPKTGEVKEKTTHQGYSAESAWSRGQAWGLYGFTMVYRETGDIRFLQQAEKIATYILTNPNLPENLIPFWDFNAPDIQNAPLDASAAAITASALYELCKYSKNKDFYLTSADKLIKTLMSPDFFTEQDNHGFLLNHSTGSKPGNSEVDSPLIYADYYFIEAIIRKLTLQNHE